MIGDEIKTDLCKIRERLSNVEHTLYLADPETYRIQYKTKYVSPESLQYKTNNSAMDILPLRTDRIDYHHIFIHNAPHTDLADICRFIGIYIGMIYSIRNVWSIRDQSIVICIRLQYWYTDKFTQVFRSELIIQNEIDKYTTQQNRCVLFDEYMRCYNITLGNRKTYSKIVDHPPIIDKEFEKNQIKRVLC